MTTSTMHEVVKDIEDPMSKNFVGCNELWGLCTLMYYTVLYCTFVIW